jgi:peroxiredoxin
LGKKLLWADLIWGQKEHHFLINPEFKIVKIYKNIKPETHVEEALNDLKLFFRKNL